MHCKMDLPYTCSEDSDCMNKLTWDQSHCEAKHYSSNSLALNAPNSYEETDINVDSCKNFKISWAEPPVEIHEERTTDIDLPLLVWHGYDTIPKLLSVCNTGRTITVNGQWTNGRPHIEGGPLNGKYIFSQIHFHCPSEHEIDGRRYPLEMHVVHYKASYLTQERAMHEKDGTLVLVYLFQVVESNETVLSQITKMRNCLEKENARIEISKIPLSHLAKPFFCNYYVYWGSVTMKKNSYILQWIINCDQLQVTRQEVDTLLGVMSTCTKAATKGPKMKPQNSIIYRVGENYDVSGTNQTVNTETNTSRHFDLVIVPEPATICQHASPCVTKHSHRNTCATRSGEGVTCTIRPLQASRSQTLTVCDTCGGFEVEPVIPNYPCKCKSKVRKACSSCGGSKSGISWCKRKWKQCKSKCSLRSRTSSCSSTDTVCKRCTEKKKTCKKKSFFKVSSGTSCNEKYSDEKFRSKRWCDTESLESKTTGEVCPPKKSSETVSCAKKVLLDVCPPKPRETPPREKEPEVCINNTARERTPDDACKPPSEHSSASSTPCTSKSSVFRKKKKKEPKRVSKKTSVTSVKHKEKKVEKTKNSETDDELKKYETVDAKKETKTNKAKEKKSKDSPKAGKKIKTWRKSKSKENVKTSERSSEQDGKKKDIKKRKSEDEVTTLFVKMPETVLPPSNISSFCYSDLGLDEKKNSDDEDTKCATQKEYIINSVLTPGLKIPEDGKSLKSTELCFQMKHSFQSEKSDPTYVSQEYQVSIVCDSNILQEYKGMFQPRKISLGSFEKLQLVPKYQEPDDLIVRLQECVIKKQSLDKFCIDSKFLLKDWNKKNVFPGLRKDNVEGFSEEILNVFDAETQCSAEETDVNGTSPTVLECRSVQTEGSFLSAKNIVQRVICKKLDLKSQNVQTEPQDDEQKGENLKDLVRCKTRILRTTSEPECFTASKKYRQDQYGKILEAKPYKGGYPKAGGIREQQSMEKLECKIKLIKNPKNSRESSKTDSDPQVVQKNSAGKNDSEVGKRNTVYFIYDKIDKDPTTGKKIFMGRFRTNEDLRILKEHQITSKINNSNPAGSPDASDESSSAENKSTAVDKSNDSLRKAGSNPETQERSHKDEHGVHKFDPKCLDQTQFKAQNSSSVVAEVVKWFQEDGENFDLLADIIGMYKKGESTILGQPRETENVFETVYSDEDKTPGLRNPTLHDKATMCSSHSFAPENAQSVQNAIGLRTQASDDVIIVPVEVESWSKIEVVLIEHPDDNRQ